MIKYLLFDFDGTIADTIHEVVTIFNEIAPQYKLPKITNESLKVLREKKPNEILKDLHISVIKLPLVVLKIYSCLKHRILDINLCHNMDQVLHELKKAGYHLVILSSNSYENIRLFLEKNKLDFFDSIYSGSTIFGKDKMIKKLIKNLKIQKEEMIYIGDEVRDIEAARKVQIKIISVTWGYNHKSALKKMNPDFLVDHPEEIIKIVNG